jgi:hypothetical protein
MMDGGSSESEQKETLKGLLKEANDKNSEVSVRRVVRLKIYTRIMKLPAEDLKKEAEWKVGERHSVVNNSAGALYLPLDAINRLVDAVGIDSTDANSQTAINYAAAYVRALSLSLSLSLSLPL